MSKLNHISRRTFLKTIASLLTFLGSFENKGITHGEASQVLGQITPYGRGVYGQGEYPSLRTYLPVITRGEK